MTLGCSDGKLEGINCGDTPTDSFIAPDGFDYKWYKLSDPNTTLSTDRIFHVDPDDIQTYAVDMMFPGDNDCYFTLTASAIPRFPLAEATTEYIAENCTYTAHLTNISHIYTEYSDNTGETLESTYWIYPDGTVNAETEIEYPMPNDGSTVSLKLVASMGSGLCSDTIPVELKAPAILGEIIYEENVKICRGESYEFAGEQLTESGEYIDSLQTVVGGCDSILILNLEVIDNDTIFLSDTICANETYQLGDTILDTAGTYVYETTNYLGCDSTVTLELDVIDVLSYLATDDLIACADDGAIMIPISIEGGSADSLYIKFSDEALAQGFSNDSITYENSLLTIYPPTDVKPNIYTFDLTLTDTLCGAMTSPITINIYYPSSIIEQKWNNVLALLNSNYNGGYTFSSYQWYCNGSAIKNADGSYYYLGENSKFSTTDEYHVMVTRADDNVTMQSCAINPVKKVDVNDYLTAVTTRVGMGETFTLPQIESESSYTVRIYTSLGSLVSVQRVDNSNATITAPRVQGIYIVSLEFTSSTSSYKLFVE